MTIKKSELYRFIETKNDAKYVEFKAKWNELFEAEYQKDLANTDMRGLIDHAQKAYDEAMVLRNFFGETYGADRLMGFMTGNYRSFSQENMREKIEAHIRSNVKSTKEMIELLKTMRDTSEEYLKLRNAVKNEFTSAKKAYLWLIELGFDKAELDTYVSGEGTTALAVINVDKTKLGL